MEFLADDLLEGREPGTRGYDLAARYVATELAQLGVAPLGDDGGYYQHLDLVETRSIEGSVNVTIRRGTHEQALVFGEDYLIGGQARVKSKVLAPVAVVGHGITAPSLHHDDYQGVDVAGKFVAYFNGAPDRFPDVVRTHFAPAGIARPNLDKLSNAEGRGASGVLVLTTPSAWRRRRGRREPLAAHRYWLQPDGLAGVAPESVRMTVFLSPQGAETLFEEAPLTPGELLDESSRDRAMPFELGVELSVSQESKHRRFGTANVVGWIQGSDPSLKNEYVVYSAHLDHVGVGEPVDGDAIYNGAYDNASGVAVLLEVSRAFGALSRAPRRSVVFAFVTAEESGKLGSEYFVHHAPLPRESIIANVNVDMPVFLYPLRDVMMFGTEYSTLERIVSDVIKGDGLHATPDPIPDAQVFFRSDHYAFARAGLPVAYLTPGFESADPEIDARELFLDYTRHHSHMPSDDLSLAFQAESARRFTQICFLLGLKLADDDGRPEWKQDGSLGQLFAAPSGRATSRP